ncbi:peptide ABC transporter substrate-binding protein [Fructobacillus evanidus]|uniref:Periplasmic component (OppA) n=1 Tax=Fructobacillus evanidus TaxID=3064281 RepID=A0ABN9Z3S3_9LACO|nr:ABC-type oligopeptide transport system [Fructobacillus sp. LMG 32999]CAK1247376.1 ABC-type oligopeptide transport system [Fructobacillus sp. LMG 32999]CAK1251888.1 ABC-type oligopeptide transport system [Fructobacillus sp. LMG 32999]CAK1251917.1 ABC-type oligopeptide transport system [Fructobacillus sp. LMG 32999]CAK1252225.1 ABC-type oligopeptide transport system [Fructobacillus sp. LMG 32999]
MKRWQKWTVAAVVVLAAVGGSRAAGWWGTSPADDKSTLNYGLAAEIQTLDISKSTDVNSNTILGNTESNLLRVNAKGNPVPDLAKSYSVSSDGLTYTVQLRSGLKWSDGSSLTAKDFVYTWQRIADPKTASQYSYLTSGVKNADDIVAGKKPVSDLGVKADGNTLTFTLEKPMAQFKYLLSFAQFAPQKESFVKEQGSKYGTSSKTQIYSGPYKLEDWNGTNNKFKMVKNPDYWDAKNVKTKTVNWQVIKNPETAIKMYKQGKLDRAAITNSAEMYAANKNNKDVKSSALAASTYLVYNEAKNPFLANEKIREALNLATNRKDLASQATGGARDAAKSLVSNNLVKAANGEDLSTYVAPGYTYDKEKAKQLFAEGIKEVNKGKMSVTLETDADSPIAKSTVDYLKQAYESTFGDQISITEKIVPFKQRLQDANNGNFDIMATNWTGDYQDGSTFYDMFKAPDTGMNFGQFKNQAYTDAVAKAEGQDANNPSARDADWKAAEAALMSDANINPLYSWKGDALQRSNVKGVVTNPAGLALDLTYAHRK